MDSATMANVIAAVACGVSVVSTAGAVVGTIYTVKSYRDSLKKNERGFEEQIYKTLSELAAETHNKGLRKQGQDEFEAAYAYCDVAWDIYTNIREGQKASIVRRDLSDIMRQIEKSRMHSIAEVNARTRMYDPQQQPTDQRRRS